MNAASLLFAFLSLFADGVSSPERYEIAADPDARSVFTALLHRSHYGFAAEEAAFIVRCPNGNLAGIHWPAGAGRDGVEWAGEYPRGVLAIAHTHPGWLTQPSRIDRATAARTHLPVYVITQTSITKTEGGEAIVVTSGSWSSESLRDRTERSSSEFASVSQSRRE
jgi:hypothetical protein